MTDFSGLVAIVTGGASGIGAATADLLGQRGATRGRAGPRRTARARAPAALQLPLRRHRQRRRRSRRSRAVAEQLGGHRHRGQQRRDRRRRRHRRQRRRGVAPGARRQRRRHRPRDAGGAPPPAPIRARRDRQHLLGRRAGRGCPSARCTPPARARSPSLTLAMAADHVREGIRVNAVTPGHRRHAVGGAAAGAGRRPRRGRAAALRARQPMGRLVSAEEVAHAIAYLASPLSASTTGTLLAVDGGMAGVQLPH